MRINKKSKGLTVTELIISFTLIFLVVLFLFNILKSVQSYVKTNENPVYSVNQAVISKEVHEDFINLGLKEISSCEDQGNRTNDTINDLISYDTSLRSEGESNCIKFSYEDNTDGYLVYYSLDNKNIVGYISDSKNILRETPLPGTDYIYANSSCEGTLCTVQINLPVIAENLENFDLNLSYMYDSLEREVDIPENGYYDYYKLAVNMVRSEDSSLFPPDNVYEDVFKYRFINSNKTAVLLGFKDGYTSETAKINNTTIDDNKVYTVIEIEKDAFSEEVKNIHIADTITKVGVRAFPAKEIDNLYIGESVKELSFCRDDYSDPLPKLKLSDYAFFFPKAWGSSTLFCSSAFNYDVKINYLEVSENNNYFKNENYALYNKSGTILHKGTNNRKITTLPTTKYISPFAFTNIKLDSITLNEGLLQIGSTAFRDCEIDSVDFPSSIEFIGNLAFYNNNLKEAYIDENIKYIGKRAFSGTNSFNNDSVVINANEYQLDYFLGSLASFGKPVNFLKSAIDGIRIEKYNGVPYIVLYRGSYNNDELIIDDTVNYYGESISVRKIHKNAFTWWGRLFTKITIPSNMSYSTTISRVKDKNDLLFEDVYESLNKAGGRYELVDNEWKKLS